MPEKGQLSSFDAKQYDVWKAHRQLDTMIDSNYYIGLWLYMTACQDQGTLKKILPPSPGPTHNRIFTIFTVDKLFRIGCSAATSSDKDSALLEFLLRFRL